MTKKYEIIRLEKVVNNEVLIELKELVSDKNTGNEITQPLYVSEAGTPTYLQVVDKGTTQLMTTDGIETEPTYNQQMNMLKILPKTESIPVPENEEEEIIAKQVSAMRKFLPELFPKPYDSISLPTSLPTMCYPVKENTILYLTLSEFVSLDLTIGSVVCLAISVYKGDE